MVSHVDLPTSISHLCIAMTISEYPRDFSFLLSSPLFLPDTRPQEANTQRSIRSEKYGEEASRVIRATVNANLKDYEYLKSFTVKGGSSS